MPPREIRVYVVACKGRHLQLKFWCPESQGFKRRSTGTYDRREAKQQARKLEAELLTETYVARDPSATWDAFVRDYDDTELRVNSRPRSREKMISVLSLAAGFLKPKCVADMVDRERLQRLRTHWLTSTSKRTERVRSRHSVKGYMTTLMVALHWAEAHGYARAVPKLKPVKTSKLDPMKGRPLSQAEFDLMLAAVPAEVGEAAAPSWQHLLRGIWHSSLRIGELLDLHWTDDAKIRPVWPPDGLAVLTIPAAMQKNDRDQDIPMLPEFEKMILRPDSERVGYLFNPLHVEGGPGRKTRMTDAWVGRVISRIGKAAGVIVAGSGEAAKYASAHDLRRSCCQRLLAAGVSPLVVQRVMRHSTLTVTLGYYAKAQVQDDAKAIRDQLSKSGSQIGAQTDKPKPTKKRKPRKS